MQEQQPPGCPRAISARCPYEAPVGVDALALAPVDRAQLWYYNATDSTLRSVGTSAGCAAQCLTADAPQPPVPGPSALAERFAQTRFMFAAQSRGVRKPIKFNGQLFMTQAVVNLTATFNDQAYVDWRCWGQDHCGCRRRARAAEAARARAAGVHAARP